MADTCSFQFGLQRWHQGPDFCSSHTGITIQNSQRQLSHALVTSRLLSTHYRSRVRSLPHHIVDFYEHRAYIVGKTPIRIVRLEAAHIANPRHTTSSSDGRLDPRTSRWLRAWNNWRDALPRCCRLPPAAALERSTKTEAVDGYFARHRVKPGMTGWARSTAGAAAQQTAAKKFSAASNMIFITLRTGRFCSTFGY